MAFLDRTNTRYGKLVALEVDDNKISKKRQGFYWKCVCDCGNTVSVRGNMLGKQTKSCGCLKLEQNKKNLGRFTNGKTHTRLWSIWKHMNDRCFKESDTNFKNYGAKGVIVCEEWKTFETFEIWSINNGYADSLSIDRIDVTGGYDPLNCRWADQETQSNNKRNTLLVVYKGEVMSLKQAFLKEKPMISYQTAKTRYHKGERDCSLLFNKTRKYRGN